MTTPSEKKFLSNNSLDFVTAENPHMDDPRFLSLTNQMNHCLLRFTVFTRCARELGEEDTRCKYQYFRAQCACPESQLEDWMEHRARGSCHLDVLPDRSTIHCRHIGSSNLSSEFEHLQLEMLTLVVTILQQEMLRLYYVMQRDRDGMSLGGAPAGNDRHAAVHLPLVIGDHVWYLCVQRSFWTPAEVHVVHDNRSVMLDVEPGLWLSTERQAALLRPRASFEGTPPSITPWERANAQRCSASSSSCSLRGLTRVTVKRPLTDDGPFLGLRFKDEQDLVVTKVKDRSAEASGWSVGDQVVAVGSTPVSTRRELEDALEKARGTGWRRSGLQGLEFLVSRDVCEHSRATSAASGSGLILTYSATSSSAASPCSAAAEAPPWCQRGDSSIARGAEAQLLFGGGRPALARAATDAFRARAGEAAVERHRGGSVPAPRARGAAGARHGGDLEAIVGGWPRWG